MSDVSKNYRCETPRCVENVEKYGDRYHRVFERATSNWVPEGCIAKCERCGGVMREEGVWEHKCGSCGIDVEPGALVGLFVPHTCKECHDKHVDQDRKSGRICRMCGKPYSLCCC